MMLVLLSLEELRHVSFHQQKSIQSTCNVSLRKALPHNCWASAGFWLMNQLKSDEIKMNQLEAIKIGSREAKSRLGAMFSEESGFCWSGNNLWKQFFSRATSWWAAAASFIWRASGALSPLPTLKKTTLGWFFTSNSKDFLGSFYRTQVSLGSGLWVPVYLRPRTLWNFADVTLADDDTNSILADDANRAIWSWLLPLRWWWSGKLIWRCPMWAMRSPMGSARWCKSCREYWRCDHVGDNVGCWSIG